MALFLATFVNKMDKKGRISVPASFRAAASTPDFQGIVLSPSHKRAALDGFSMTRLQQFSASLDQVDLFSDAQDSLAATIFGSAVALAFDPEGRITLPPELAAHAGLTEQIAFIGLGQSFQIWEPSALEAYKAEARDQAKAQNLTLKLGQQTGDKV